MKIFQYLSAFAGTAVAVLLALLKLKQSEINDLKINKKVETQKKTDFETYQEIIKDEYETNSNVPDQLEPDSDYSV